MATVTEIRRSAPSAEGVAAGGIAAFLDAIEAQGLEVHSFMLLRHGAVVAEGWWAPYAPDLPHMLFSLSKSFTATAVGLAAHEGRFSIDDPVASFFRRDLPPSVGPNLGAMRVRHLLMMATGHDQDTTERIRRGGGPDWVKAFLRLPVEHAPGSKFVYNSGASYMLAAIVQKTAGATLLDYLTPRLLEPLGIGGATWEMSPEGIHTGGWGLSLTTEDIARFGQLYLGKGRWQTRQVVPAAWVGAATAYQMGTAGAGNPDWAQGYGYQFWRSRHGLYRGDGAHGQFCIVMPQHDAVCAMTGGTDRLQAVLDCVWAHLLPALGAAGDAAEDEALRARLARLTLAPSQPASAGAGPLTPASGRTYVFAPNPAGLESVALDTSADACRVTVVRAGLAVTFPCGFGHWSGGHAPRVPGGASVPWSGWASWEDGGRLRLDWRCVTTPFGGTLRLAAAGDGVTAEYRTNLGEFAEGIEARAS